MKGFGQELIDLHLLKSKKLDYPTIKFMGEGTELTIYKPKYVASEKKIYINDHYYFSDVSSSVWEYEIGGYQVLKRFLKYRKGQRMEDPRHYIHIATALEKTIEIQAEIDAIYPEVEKDVIKF